VKAKVTVYPRREILDPQGLAIRDALARLGFEEIEQVRAGKSFDIELEAPDAEQARQRLEAMCRKLLANPVVEDFSIDVVDDAAGEEGGAA
jgi:phosphoribosylformylglycinamidine synthase